MKITLRGEGLRGLKQPRAEGEALVTQMPISFLGFVSRFLRSDQPREKGSGTQSDHSERIGYRNAHRSRGWRNTPGPQVGPRPSKRNRKR